MEKCLENVFRVEVKNLMSNNCTLCEKKVSQTYNNSEQRWEEVLRNFYKVKSKIVCTDCANEIQETRFRKIKHGRKHIRYEYEPAWISYRVGGTFNRGSKC